MADRSNHYERALASYLRSLRVKTIPIDESRRAFHQDDSIKSPDFIVPLGAGGFLLVDVKGRQLPRPSATRQNWATEDDVRSLLSWQNAFGSSAHALLVFVYQLAEESMTSLFTDHFRHEDRAYGCLGIAVSDYSHRMRVRSPRWQTVNLLKSDFDAIARPLSTWLHPEPAPRA